MCIQDMLKVLKETVCGRWRWLAQKRSLRLRSFGKGPAGCWLSLWLWRHATA